MGSQQGVDEKGTPKRFPEVVPEWYLKAQGEVTRAGGGRPSVPPLINYLEEVGTKCHGGGVINPPIICWPQFCCGRRFCWRDRSSLNRLVKWRSTSAANPAGLHPEGQVTSQSHAALGISSWCFAPWAAGNFLKDTICLMQEAGRTRGEERRKGKKGDMAVTTIPLFDQLLQR